MKRRIEVRITGATPEEHEVIVAAIDDALLRLNPPWAGDPVFENWGKQMALLCAYNRIYNSEGEKQ